MASLNKVQLIGNVGKEPENRQVGDNVVIKFTVATTERFTDRNGQQVDNTEWHNVEYWSRNGGILQYLHKGTQVYVEGKLKTDSWQGQDGKTNYKTSIRAQVLQLLGGKPQGQQAPQQGAAEIRQQYQQGLPQYQQAPPQYQQVQPRYQPQGFQQTGQFPQQPVNQPYPPQYQQTDDLP